MLKKSGRNFLKDSLIFNPYHESGLGPVMFGGFSFDPLKAKTTLWSKYADSLFHIPKYMLTILKGQTFLTTNIVCTPNDDFTLFEKVIKERIQLLSSPVQDFNRNSSKASTHERNCTAPVEAECR